VGTVLGWVPYRLTGRVAARFPGADATDVRATAKALVGAAAFLAWTLLLVLVAALVAGPWAALATLVLLPPLLAVALLTGEGWQDARRDARRHVLLRRRAARAAELRARQGTLAAELRALVARLEALPHAPAPDPRGTALVR
jgi:fatty acid desaturase